MANFVSSNNMDNWTIEEEVFYIDQVMQGQSIYTLCNGYLSSRGFFEERIATEGLVANYIRGLYEKDSATQKPFLVNSANFWDVEIYLNNRFLDLTSVSHIAYCRKLHLNNGQLTREIVWEIDGVELTVQFCRFLDMQHTSRAYQQIVFSANKQCSLRVVANLRFDEKQHNKQICFTRQDVEDNLLICKTPKTDLFVGGAMLCDLDGEAPTDVYWDDKVLSHLFETTLTANQSQTFTRYSAVVCGKDNPKAKLLQNIVGASQETFPGAVSRNEQYWQNYWEKQIIPAKLDAKTLQGTRYCLFQVAQNQQLVTANNLLGARGLSGVLGGNEATWHNELVVFPYFLNNYKQNALHIVLSRFGMLNSATELAKQSNCLGSRFAVATIQGEESSSSDTFCQANLLSTLAVSWAIEQYTAENNILFNQAQAPLMMINIARYLVTRGQWNDEKNAFSFYCVSGADSFHPIQNHNYLINYMAQHALRFVLKLIKDLPTKQLSLLQAKTGFTATELVNWKKCADSMLLSDNDGVLQQFDGYSSLPTSCVNVAQQNISSLSWDVLCRSKGLSVSDVLLLFNIYPNEFSKEVMVQNLEYYKNNILHRDCISYALCGSVFASVDNQSIALEYLSKACRLDLDNTLQDVHNGLHIYNCFAVANLLQQLNH